MKEHGTVDEASRLVALSIALSAAAIVEAMRAETGIEWSEEPAGNALYRLIEAIHEQTK